MRARLNRSNRGALAGALALVACCVAAPLLIGAACVALGAAGELALAVIALCIGAVVFMRRRAAR
jgi:hypothetical protein